MTLYELEGQWKALLELAEESDPEIFADTLEGLEGEIGIKADDYGKVIRCLESDADAVEAEEKRLTARKKAIKANISSMKTALIRAMGTMKKKKLTGELFAFTVRENPPSVVIDDPEKVPGTFMTWPEPVPSKTLIKDALEHGRTFEWAHLERGKSLIIN